MFFVARGRCSSYSEIFLVFVKIFTGRAVLKPTRPANQSDHVTQIRASSFSPREGVILCCSSVDQSATGMQINNRRPLSLALNHCLRAELLKDSHNSLFSSFSYITTHSHIMNSSNPILPPDTFPQPTAYDLHSTLVHPPDSQPLLNSTAEQTDLLSFVENFLLSSPNFKRLSPRPTMRSRQVRQHNRTRERAAKTRFVAARTVSRKEGHSQLLEAMRRCRLSRPRKIHTAAKVGVFAYKGGKPILSKSKKEIVGLPGLFDANLVAELTEEDRFLGPMKRAIINKDVTSFNKLGAYMAQF